MYVGAPVCIIYVVRGTMCSVFKMFFTKCMLSFFNLQEVGLALGVRVCSIYK